MLYLQNAKEHWLEARKVAAACSGLVQRCGFLLIPRGPGLRGAGWQASHFPRREWCKPRSLPTGLELALSQPPPPPRKTASHKIAARAAKQLVVGESRLEEIILRASLTKVGVGEMQPEQDKLWSRLWLQQDGFRECWTSAKEVLATHNFGRQSKVDLLDKDLAADRGSCTVSPAASWKIPGLWWKVSEIAKHTLIDVFLNVVLPRMISISSFGVLLCYWWSAHQ